MNYLFLHKKVINIVHGIMTANKCSDYRIVQKQFYKDNFLMFLPPGLMLLFGNFGLSTLFLWTVTLLFTGLTFIGTGLTAAHHDPDNFHEGDEPR